MDDLKVKQITNTCIHNKALRLFYLLKFKVAVMETIINLQSSTRATGKNALRFWRLQKNLHSIINTDVWWWHPNMHHVSNAVRKINWATVTLYIISHPLKALTTGNMGAYSFLRIPFRKTHKVRKTQTVGKCVSDFYDIFLQCFFVQFWLTIFDCSKFQVCWRKKIQLTNFKNFQL